jgi:S-(hydroxymethyl)mycothiol dehydrogenase
VFGAGPVGLFAAKSAWLMGAGRVIVVDHLDYRLEKAQTFAHAETINFTEHDDIVVHLKRITEHLGADVVIDAVGRPETFQQAFYARDLAGTAVLVGVPTPEWELRLPLIDVFARGGAIKSSWYGDCLPSRDFPVLADLYLQGRLPLEKFVTETIGLDDVEEAFAKMHRGDVLRSVVVLESAS